MGGSDGLERTNFQQFLLLVGVVVLKELIFNSFLHWKGSMVLERTHLQQFLHCEAVVVLKELILTVSTFGGCGDLQRINF